MSLSQVLLLAVVGCGDSTAPVDMSSGDGEDVTPADGAQRDGTEGDGADGAHDDGAHDDGAHDDGATGDGAHDDGATGDGASGDGATGDGASGDGASGDGASGDGASGDGASGDGASGDGASGDGATGDGASGDGATGDGAEGGDRAGCSDALGGEVPDGAVRERTRFAAEHVAPGEQCESERQESVCSDGTWGPYTGSFTAISCRVDPDPAEPLTITSPRELPLVANLSDATCDDAHLGEVVRSELRVSVDGVSSVVNSSYVCESDEWLGDIRYDFEIGPHPVADFFGTPVVHTWGAFVRIREHGEYKGTLTVELLETESLFRSEACQFGRDYVQRNLANDRGAADAPEESGCSSFSGEGPDGWRSYGELKVRYIANGPTAMFYPRGGGTPVEVTFFAL